MKCPSCRHDVPPSLGDGPRKGAGAQDHAGACPSCGAPLDGHDGHGVDEIADSEKTTILERAKVGPDRAGMTVPDQAGFRRPVQAPIDGGRFPSGTMLGERYRIVSLLGRGGMGEVYRAEDLRLETAVAIKLLPEPLEKAPEWLEQLGQEVKLARQVTHPNVCRIYDLGEADGLSFLSMEYISGDDLRTLLRKSGRLRQERAVEIGLGVCRGLAAAHEQGILHRDLKPGNVMIDLRGEARVSDFGLAAWVGSVGGSQARDGTPAYMAPEQRAGGEVTVQSDLYALGLVLYELFTGERLAPGTAPSSDAFEDVDPAVKNVVLHCLAQDPAERPDSAQEVAQVLKTRRPSSWVPAAELEIPKRPRWILEKKLRHGGFGEEWLARHHKTREPRAFKFYHDTSRLRALRRESMLFRLLKKGLGERDDVARIFEWDFESAPYFIESEYTEDGDLVEWARRQGGLAAIPLAARLEIVAQVATALAAAHAIGVLHKDVKPRNVLIRETSMGGVRAQLSDFGVGALTERDRLVAAGITDVELTEKLGDSYTGTRLYMAPELLEGKPATVQADTYALGVMLYQMVVGDFSRALAPGWRRDVDDELLREDVATAVDGSPDQRLDNVLRLAERLRDLEGRRARREAERREREEEVRLRAAYVRSRKRRRVLAVAVTILLMFGGAMTVMYYVVEQEKKRMEEARDFLRDLINVPDSYIAENIDTNDEAQITFEDVLDRGVKMLTDKFGDDPSTRAEISGALGNAYRRLGRYDEAERLLAEALALKAEVRGSTSLYVAEALNGRAFLYWKEEDYDKAENAFREALEMYRTIQGSQHPDVATVLNNLGLLLYHKGEYREAEGFLRDALEMRVQTLSSDNALIAKVLSDLAWTLRKRGIYEEARQCFQEALDLNRKVLGNRHSITATSCDDLASLLIEVGDLEGAEPLLVEALDARRQKFGGDQSDYARSLVALGQLRHAQGLYGEAKKHFVNALDIQALKLEPDRSEILFTKSHLAATLLAIGKNDGVEATLQEALSQARQQWGENHPETISYINQLASAFRDMGNLSRAEKLYREALAIVRGNAEVSYSDMISSCTNLAGILYAKKKFTEAAEILDETLKLQRRTLKGDYNPRIADTLHSLASSLYRSGDRKNAEPRFREALEIYRRFYGDEHPYVADTLNQLALLLQDVGKKDEAVERLREALEIRRKDPDADSWKVAQSLNNLARALVACGNADEAHRHIREALEIYRSVASQNDWHVANAESIRAAVLASLGRYSEAEKLLRKSYPIVRDEKGQDSFYTRDILERFVGLYDAWGKPEEAARYRELWTESGDLS